MFIRRGLQRVMIVISNDGRWEALREGERFIGRELCYHAFDPYGE